MSLYAYAITKKNAFILVGYIRTMAETLGRTPKASLYSPNMSQHLSQVKTDKNGFAMNNWHLTYDLDKK